MLRLAALGAILLACPPLTHLASRPFRQTASRPFRQTASRPFTDAASPPFTDAASPAFTYAVERQHTAVNPDAATILDFKKHVDEYIALHKKLEATLPALPKQTTPQQMDEHERALAKLIQQARANAKPGDIFTPPMQRFVRRVLIPIFAGTGGPQIKSEITDKEYKGDVKLVVNGRYPDEVPVSTMPPQVLKALPQLPEELEYRFVLTSLILFDPRAHIIPDFVDHAFH